MRTVVCLLEKLPVLCMYFHTVVHFSALCQRPGLELTLTAHFPICYRALLIYGESTYVILSIQCVLLGVFLVPVRAVLLSLVLMVTWPVSVITTFQHPLKGAVRPMTGWRR